MVTLHCKASSPEGDPPKIRWLKDGKLLQGPNLPERYSLVSSGTLDIDSKYFYYFDLTALFLILFNSVTYF